MLKKMLVLLLAFSFVGTQVSVFAQETTKDSPAKTMEKTAPKKGTKGEKTVHKGTMLAKSSHSKSGKSMTKTGKAKLKAGSKMSKTTKTKTKSSESTEKTGG